MSVLIQAHCELGRVPGHLQCPHCGYYSKSHAHQMSHIAASHPTHLDRVAFGRLGNILMYQSTAQLYHCFDCFFTSKDFTKVYKHVIAKHCMDEREATEESSEKGEEKVGQQGKEEQKEGGEGSIRRKQTSKDEEDEAKKPRVETEEEGGVKTTKSNQGQEVEEEGRHDNGDAPQMADKTNCEREESVLIFDGLSFCCMMCSWKSKLKGVAINHVVRKHDVPRAYAIQAIKRDAAADEDETASLNSELLRVEMEATAKVISAVSNRFVCQICGWTTKLKGQRQPSSINNHMTAAVRANLSLCMSLQVSPSPTWSAATRWRVPTTAETASSPSSCPAVCSST